MDDLIQFKRSDLILIKKKERIYHLVDFANLIDYRAKIKRKKNWTNT